MLVLHRPGPVARRAAQPRPARAARTAAPAAAHRARRASRVALRAVRRAAAPAQLRHLGRVGGAPSLALALRGCGARSRSTSCTPTTPRPPATPCGAPGPASPIVVSVHGGDVLAVADRSRAGAAAVRAGLAHARLVLANSAGIAARARALGARRHAGRPPRHRSARAGGRAPWRGRSSPSPTSSSASATPTCCARSGCCATATPTCAGTWSATALSAKRSSGSQRSSSSDGRVRFHGALPPAEAQAAARAGGVFVLPSVDEAFGVAYVEAMAGGVPAIGCRGEPGPEEIARAGGGPAAGRARRSRGARRASWARCWTSQAGGASSAPPPARPSRAGFTWEQCGRGDGRRLRGGARVIADRRPVLFVTNHAPSFRDGRVRRARTAARRSCSRWSAAGCVTAARSPRTRPASRSCAPASAGSAARRVGPLPRRRRRPLGPRRAPRRLPRRPGRARARSCCGRRSGATRARPPTRSPSFRCATSTATPTRSPPTARTSPPT